MWAQATYHTTDFSYDTNGHLELAAIRDDRNRNVHYVTDALGQVLSRTENDGVGDPRQIYFYFDGVKVGDLSNDGPSDTDYAGAIANRNRAPSLSPWSNNSHAVQSADFDQSYDAINPTSEGSVSGRYTAGEGDTLQSIALAVWGDSAMWYMLAEANGLTSSSHIAAGMTLSIPAKVTNIHNNADTFRVYDPNKTIGDVHPSETAPPPPPKSEGCGIVGKLLIVAIAVAVTLIIKVPVTNLIAFGSTVAPTVTVAGVTSVAAAGAAATIAGAAVTGAVASGVSQAFGVATGLQDKFSWKGVAMAGISAGLGEGLGHLGAVHKGLAPVSKYLGGAGFAQGAARGALVNLGTQGIAIATGLQHRFDWAGLAAAAVVGGVTSEVGLGIDSGHPSNHILSHLERGVAGAAGALAGAATRSALTGTSFGDNIMAVLPDVIGSTIGEMVAEGVSFRGGAAGGPVVAGGSAGLADAAAFDPMAAHQLVRIGEDNYQVTLVDGTLVSGSALDIKAALEGQIGGLHAAGLGPRAGAGSVGGALAAAEQALASGSFGYGSASLDYIEGGTGSLSFDVMSGISGGLDMAGALGKWSNNFGIDATSAHLIGEIQDYPEFTLALAQYTAVGAILIPEYRTELAGLSAGLMESYTPPVVVTGGGGVGNSRDAAIRANIADRFADLGSDYMARVSAENRQERASAQTRFEAQWAQQGRDGVKLYGEFGQLVNPGVALAKTVADYRNGNVTPVDAALNAVTGRFKVLERSGSLFRGGAYGRLPGGPGIERHHLPAHSVNPFTRYSGSAIEMDRADHLLTSSHGSGLEAALYRSEIHDLIENGQMRKAMAIEIRDVRRAAVDGGGSIRKYNAATREMLDYSYDRGWLGK